MWHHSWFVGPNLHVKIDSLPTAERGLRWRQRPGSESGLSGTSVICGEVPVAVDRTGRWPWSEGLVLLPGSWGVDSQ